MSSSPVTDDYYGIIGVSPSATIEEITRSYRRLALHLHPDRNKKPDATATFQLLSRGYEILKDAEQRRSYDRIYHTVKKSKPQETPPRRHEEESLKKEKAPNQHNTSQSSTSTTETEAARDIEEIARIRRVKQQCAMSWCKKKRVIDGSIFELERQVRNLQREIETIKSTIAAAEASEIWDRSFIFIFEPSEEEKERKSRQEQDRRSQKDMKERRLDSALSDLRYQRERYEKKETEFSGESSKYDDQIWTVQNRINQRREEELRNKKPADAYEREEREKKTRAEWREREKQQQAEAREREMLEKKQREKEKRKREELERRRETERAEIRKRQEAEQEQRRLRELLRQGLARQKQELERKQQNCHHEGWWPKVQGFSKCSQCGEMWRYLLECPHCRLRACSKCQYDLRTGRRQ